MSNFKNPWEKGGELYPDFEGQAKENLFDNDNKVLSNPESDSTGIDFIPSDDVLYQIVSWFATACGGTEYFERGELMSEDAKQIYFRDSMEATLGILLKEFATGKGADLRHFYSSNYNLQYDTGRMDSILANTLQSSIFVQEAINDFYRKHNKDSYIEPNTVTTEYYYVFSPDFRSDSRDKVVDSMLDGLPGWFKTVFKPLFKGIYYLAESERSLIYNHGVEFLKTGFGGLFIGGCRVNVTAISKNNDDKISHFKLVMYNETSLKSLLYQTDVTNRHYGKFSNIAQYIYLIEAIDFENLPNVTNK